MKSMYKRNRIIALICGLLGCLCFGAGDWLIIYGDPTYTGAFYWLTEGVLASGRYIALHAPINAMAILLLIFGVLLWMKLSFSRRLMMAFSTIGW